MSSILKLLCSALVVWLIVAFESDAQSRRLAEWQISITPQENLVRGTIIDVRDNQDRTVLAFGFPYSMGTGFQYGGQTLAGFVSNQVSEPEWEDLGRPFPDGVAVRLSAHRGDLLAINRATNETAIFLDDTKEWARVYPHELIERWALNDNWASEVSYHLCGEYQYGVGAFTVFRSCIFLDNKLIINLVDHLVYSDDIAQMYNLYINFDENVLTSNISDINSIYQIYVSTNYIAFAGIGVGSGQLEEGQPYILFCPMSRSVLFVASCATLSVENAASLYVVVPDSIENVDTYFFFSDGRVVNLNTMNFAHNTVRNSSGAYQFYSYLPFENSYLIGGYPWAVTLRGTDAGLTALDSQIAQKHDGFERRYNFGEVQSLAHFAGAIYAGVWPWGELYKYENDDFVLVRRLFSAPEIGRITLDPAMGPRESEPFVIETGGNNLGQRIESMVQRSEFLYLSTSPKYHDFSEFRNLPVEFQHLEQSYGRVYRMSQRGAIGTEIYSGGSVEPLALTVQLYTHFVRVLSGDEIVAQASLDTAVPCVVRSLAGEGAFGPARGFTVSITRTRNNLRSGCS